MKRLFIYIVCIVLCCCAALAFCVDLEKPALRKSYSSPWMTEAVWNVCKSVQGTSMQSTALFVLFLLISKYTGSKRKKLIVSFAAVSFLLAAVWLCAASFVIDNTLTRLTSSHGQIAKSILYVLGMTYTIYQCMLLLDILLHKESGFSAEGFRNTAVARRFARNPLLCNFLLYLLLYLPHLIISWPGYVHSDALTQIAMAFGNRTFTTHHPPILSPVFAAFARLGMLLGSGAAGFTIYDILQFIAFFFVHAYQFSVLKELKTPYWLRFIMVILIAFMPYYIYPSMTMAKDVPFTLAFLLFSLQVTKLLSNAEGFLKSRKDLFIMAGSVFAVLACRNNGIYVMIPSVLILPGIFALRLRARQSRRSLAVLSAALILPVILYSCCSQLVISHYDAQPGSIREMLSIPFQQTARYINVCGDEVTEEEKQIIDAVLDYDVIAAKYDPIISDNVKNTYHAADNAALMAYFRVWAQQFAKHPLVCLEATLNQNCHIVYPFVRGYDGGGVGTRNLFTDYQQATKEQLGLWPNAGVPKITFFMEGYYTLLENIPFIGIFSNCGTYGVLLVFLCVFAARKKFGKWFLAALPTLVLMLTLLAGPVIKPRYQLAAMYTIPLLIAYYIKLYHDAKLPLEQ